MNVPIPFGREIETRSLVFGTVESVYLASVDVRLASGSLARRARFTSASGSALKPGERVLLLWDAQMAGWVVVLVVKENPD